MEGPPLRETVLPSGSRHSPDYNSKQVKARSDELKGDSCHLFFLQGDQTSRELHLLVLVQPRLKPIERAAAGAQGGGAAFYASCRLPE